MIDLGHIRVVVDECAGDDSIYFARSQRWWNSRATFEPCVFGSTRAFGALMAHNLAHAYRPDGLA